MMMPNMLAMQQGIMGNNVQLPFDASTGKFDHSLINPVQLGSSITEIESVLTEIEQLKEVQKIKDIFKDAEGLSKYQILGMIFFFCLIGIVFFCYMMCKAGSLNKKLSYALRDLKSKADDVLKKYNPILNSQGNHAFTKINEMLPINAINSNGFTSSYFSVFISLSSKPQNQQYPNDQIMLNEKMAFNQQM